MIYDKIEGWARTSPGKIAIRYNGQDISYQRLAEAVELCRSHFVKRGITGSGIAVLAVHHLVDFWILSLALRGLGLTTIAISAPQSLRTLHLKGVRCIVKPAAEAWQGLDEVSAEMGIPLLSFALTGSDRHSGLHHADHAPGGHIIQTSGTTGSYKMVRWDAAMENEARILQANEQLGIGPDTLFNIFNYGPWTAAAYMIPLTVWTAGGGVIIHQKQDLDTAMLNYDATHAALVPHVLAQILAAPEGSFPRNDQLHVWIGGGTVTRQELSEIRRRISPIVYNQLASTEAGAFASTKLDSDDDHRWHKLLPNRVVEIVDENDELVKMGQLGRVRVDTVDCPQGYLDNPEATEAFFRNGFFYPGDLAIAREDGRIALHGRVTDVINFRGHKLSPGPMEDYLRGELGLSGICLLSAQNAHGEELLHVVIEADQPPSLARLKQLLERQFTDVTVQIRFVQKLPRTETGKVMRNHVREQVLMQFATT